MYVYIIYIHDTYVYVAKIKQEDLSDSLILKPSEFFLHNLPVESNYPFAKLFLTKQSLRGLKFYKLSFTYLIKIKVL